MSRSFRVIRSICVAEGARASVIAKPPHACRLAVLLLVAGMTFTANAVAAPGAPGVSPPPTAIHSDVVSAYTAANPGADQYGVH